METDKIDKIDDIYLWMSDWDLGGEGYDWEQQILEAAHIYYENHPERRSMKDKNIISNYKSWKREQVYGER